MECSLCFACFETNVFCKYLSLKDLTLKLTMLITLTMAAKSQSLNLLCIEGMVKKRHAYVLKFQSLLKQDRPGHCTSFVKLKTYTADRRLCVMTVLKGYLKRTSLLRGTYTALMLSYGKPHRPVASATISRWNMTKAGIATSKFSGQAECADSCSPTSFHFGVLH